MKLRLITIVVALSFSLVAGNMAGAYTIDHSSSDPGQIPAEYITRAKTDLHIAYNHTSHGSQLITGLNALRDFPSFNGRYDWVDSSIGNTSAVSLDDRGIPGIPDLSQGDYVEPGDPDGVAKWARDTYTFLSGADAMHVNVVMWSWCDISPHDIDLYLDSMEWLISLFGQGGSHPRAADHPVQFVFMTGHANGGGIDDSSDTRNQQIRAHCRTHKRILFDFSDIENFDPDDNYYLDKRVDDALYYDSTAPYTSGSRDANWATEYLSRHDGEELDLLVNGSDGYPGCGSCAHSPESGETADARLNCILKGRALWVLFARLAGWDPGIQPPPPPPPPTGAGSAGLTGQLHLLLDDV